ncbi:MAG: hypothetical protein BWY79_01376 [Actinobacteria bacterium ADurb.Bin444]|nr:MAG: hypothetical protein BWY79_01376 [Actinobacteria bacterium ADurb.Bin444]
MAAQEVTGPVTLSGQRDEHVFGRDVTVLHVFGFRLGLLEHIAEVLAQGQLRGAGHRSEATQLVLEVRLHHGRVGADLLEDGHGESPLLVEKGNEQVLSLHLGMIAAGRQLVGGGQRLLCLDGEPV